MIYNNNNNNNNNNNKNKIIINNNNLDIILYIIYIKSANIFSQCQEGQQT